MSGFEIPKRIKQRASHFERLVAKTLDKAIELKLAGLSIVCYPFCVILVELNELDEFN